MCDFRFALSTAALLLLLRPRCILRPSEMEKINYLLGTMQPLLRPHLDYYFLAEAVG